jgi:S-adenosylmethionine:tRNA ribosyltransferase-isomerase
MIAAHQAVQRPADAKLLAIDAVGDTKVIARSAWTTLLRPGDLVIANDAATLPASLTGRHASSRAPIEIRLAGRASLDAEDVSFEAVLFGDGDYKTRTEDRPPPPQAAVGDVLELGPLRARVAAVLDHPRFVRLEFDGDPATVWAGIARHGRPVQYAHVQEPLRLWDVWTAIAGAPVAFEPPSAGFVLNWAALRAIRARGASFATLTHAAGLSSTGDPALDARLPLPEPYHIPRATADAIRRARRVIAIGTTVTRALEHAGRSGVVHGGAGLADQRIGPDTELAVVDAILTGAHEADSSHHQLLRAFADDRVLARAAAVLAREGFRTHEFGDSVVIERRSPAARHGRRAA